MSERIVSSLIDKVEDLCQESNELRAFIALQGAELNQLRDLLTEQDFKILRCQSDIEGIKPLVQ